MGSHVTLLGDSIFDNKAYTRGAPDVAAHLRDLLPEWGVTLCARDGSTTTDVGWQLDRVPAATTHLVLSLGGNDAILNADLLDRPVRSTAEALALFENRLAAFEVSYGRALEAILDLQRHTTICTIYNGNLPDGQAGRARVALTLFNDAILRAALAQRVDVIDLRAVCTEASDYANPIEPSGFGGRKIARAIARALGPAVPGERRTMLLGA
jgi:hypothetical protein